jgi:hypothetical protein
LLKFPLSLHQFFGVKSLVFSLIGGTRFFYLYYFKKKYQKVCNYKKSAYLCIAFEKVEFGAVAQSVEQRIENPCVGGSIPSHTTKQRVDYQGVSMKILTLFLFMYQKYDSFV